MKRAFRPHSQAAFTLIEIMTVLLIAAVLAAFSYPAYLQVRLKTARAEGRAALMRLMQQQERYYTEHHGYRHFAGEGGIDAGSDSSGFRDFSGETAAASAYRLKARACESGSPDADSGDCVLLRATPSNGLVDPACDVLTLDSTGKQGASGPGACW
jgi:type IV pilus assembly protein PilE